MRLLIKNGIVVSEELGGEKKADILIENDKIIKIAEQIDDENDQVLDVEGLYVLPGFIDMHCAVCDPGHESVEDIETVSMSAAAGGFTTITAQPDTQPAVDNKTVVEYIITKSKEYADVNILPYGSMTLGCKGERISEIGEMVHAGIVGIADGDLTVGNAEIMRNIFVYSKMFDMPVITHCEDMALSGKGVINEGRVSTQLGLLGIPREAEDIIVARNIVLAENAGARLHIAHVSTKGAVRLIKAAKKRGVNLTCDTCPHYFTVTEDVAMNYNTYAKVIPPLRTDSDIKAIAEGVADGTIDVISSGHAPTRKEFKQREFDTAAYGISALETAFALSYTELVKNGLITMGELVNRLSEKPAKVLGLNTKGKLAVGYDADITIADCGEEYVIDAEKFYSKAKFTPVHGRKVCGRIKHTMVGGKIIL